jgi:hypothetical protein
MAQWEWLVKLVVNYGGAGGFCWMMWSLINNWAGKFLEAHTQQVQAMTTQAAATANLAQAVKDGRNDDREVLMAVRLLADRIEMQKGYLIRIDDQLQSVKLEASRRVA